MNKRASLIILTVFSAILVFLSAVFMAGCDLFSTAQGSEQGDSSAEGDASSGGDVDSGANSGSGSGTNSGTDSGSGSGTNSGTDSGSGSGTNSGAHSCKFVFKSNVSADCLNGGYDVYACSCGKKEKRNKVKALGHDYKDTVHNATCTTDWSMTSVCSRCGDTKTVVVEDSKAAHDYEWKEVTTVTCTQNGTQSGKCKNCGATDIKTIPAPGHSYGAYVSNNDATCAKDGTESAVCATCNHVDTKTVAGSKLGHSYGAFKVDFAATCENAGRESAVCATCKDVKTREIAATGHTFVNDVCSKCGAISSSLSNGLLFADRGTYCEVIGLGTASGDIVIPATYNGKPVTEIGWAFNGYSQQDVKEKVTGLVIPDSVTSIMADACFGCDNLVSVVIGDGVTGIGDNAFGNCPKLKDVTLGSNVEAIGDAAFANCESLTRIRLPEKLTNIESNAFYGCKNLVAIMFGGTKAQWNAVTKGNQWFGGTKPCTVYCKDGNITI